MRIATIGLMAAMTAAILPLGAQDIKLPPNLEKLSGKAEESVVITLDKSMLQFASRFMDKDGGEEKKIVAGLDSIYVRSFEFSNDGEYTKADVEEVRSQFQPPAWGRIVGVRSRRSEGDVDVYFKDGGNGKLGGIVVVCAEPRELTIVHITGTIDPASLAELGGDFGIPRLEIHGDWRSR
jgi:hypothetical protein